MQNRHVKYALVGGGAAGSAAAEAIRARDPAGSILMVGQEHSRPYYRPELSKRYLRREASRSDLAIDLAGNFAQKHIDMYSGRRVAHLDCARQAIALDSGEEIAYDKLLLATGASPKPLRIPGADLPNVFYLRTIEDCDRIHHAMDKAKLDGRAHPTGKNTSSGESGRIARGRAVVIGSGLLAVEAAASLKQSGIYVDLVVGRAHPWGKFAGDATGSFVQKYLEAHGIAVHVNAAPTQLDGDGRVQRVTLADGQTLDCDFALVAVGIVSNRELLRGTPIAAEKSVLVDDHCRTSVEGIYASGDCAAIYDPLFGKHRLLDHWDSARVMGAIAGSNMAGADRAYNIVNSYFSEIFDLKLQAWGDGRFVDRRLIRATPGMETPDFAEIGVTADGRVSQVLAIGRNSEHAQFERLVGKRFNITGREEEIRDPSKSLEEI